MLAQHAAHRERDGGEEVGAVLPLHRRLHQPQQGLVDDVALAERRRVVPVQARRGHAQELALQRADDAAEGVAVAALPGVQQHRHGLDGVAFGGQWRGGIHRAVEGGGMPFILAAAGAPRRPPPALEAISPHGADAVGLRANPGF
jgi:hypothetical protein